MKPYRPSNKIPSSGFIFLLLSSLVGSITVAGITLAASNLIYPVIIAPLLMGGTASIANLIGIKFGKVRNPIYASIFAALSGLIVYGTFRVGEYLQFKQQFERQISEQLNLGNRTSSIDLNMDSLIDSFLAQETGSKGFLGYLKYQA